LVNKEGAFGGGTQNSTTQRGIGLYVSFLGGVLGLIATAIVVRELMAPASAASDPQPAFDLGEVTEQNDR
jgi:hypothetical protein